MNNDADGAVPWYQALNFLQHAQLTNLYGC